MRSLGPEPFLVSFSPFVFFSPFRYFFLFLPLSRGLTPVAPDGSKERSIKLLTYPDYPFRSTNQKVTKSEGERSLRFVVVGVCSIRNEV